MRRDDDYRVSHALNRRMADFCAADERLLGVGLIPLDDVDAACQELEHLIGLGLKAVWIPHRPMGRSPGHPDLDHPAGAGQRGQRLAGVDALGTARLHLVGGERSEQP